MSAQNVAAYAAPEHDPVRNALEPAFFARLVPRLLAKSGGGRLLDLGCGDSLAARLAGPALTSYTGLDQRPLDEPVPGQHVNHDLSEGLGPVGPEPFDVYLATFGVASHLRPAELRSLLGEIAAHARPGSLVALEALGLHSLEWPGLWEKASGAQRILSYRLRHDVEVHPWSAHELLALHEDAGLEALMVLDRTTQAGPKTGDGRLWPGVPALRAAINALLEDPGAPQDEARAILAESLPPLPAGPAAAVHQRLARRRRELLHGLRTGRETVDGTELAHAVWALEPCSGGGFGHGLTVAARVP